MGDNTKIEWCDASWSPVTGCDPIGDGCLHCYAKRLAWRFRGRNGFPTGDPFAVTVHEDRMHQPYEWKKPRRIFVCSMGDLFHAKVPLPVIDRIVQICRENPQHRFIILTKRPGNVLRYQQWKGLNFTLPSNIWLGVSVWDQISFNTMVQTLNMTWVENRFISLEPMLGAVDMTLCANPWDDIEVHMAQIKTLKWVIAGGETGPGARPIHPLWIRQLVSDCDDAQVPFFFKGWGEWFPVHRDRESGDLGHFHPDKDLKAYRGHPWGDGWTSLRLGRSKTKPMDIEFPREFPKELELA
jgi:protein gp37